MIMQDQTIFYILSKITRRGHEKVPLRISKEGASYFVGEDREIPQYGYDNGKATITGRKKIFSKTAKLTFVKSRNIWKLYWRRASGLWHLYGEYPTLDEAVQIIDGDPDHCFWG